MAKQTALQQLAESLRGLADFVESRDDLVVTGKIKVEAPVPVTAEAIKQAVALQSRLPEGEQTIYELRIDIPHGQGIDW